MAMHFVSREGYLRLLVFWEVQSFVHPHFSGWVAKNPDTVVILCVQILGRSGSEDPTVITPACGFFVEHHSAAAVYLHAHCTDTWMCCFLMIFKNDD